MFVEFPTTAMPVLGGVVAEITVTVKRVVSPGATIFEFAAPPACSVAPRLQAFVGLFVFFGVGAEIVKSAELLSVSEQPFPLRFAAVAEFKSAVLAPSKHEAPLP